jgi:hypothetical protein
MSWRCRFAPCIGQVMTFLNPKDPTCFGVRQWWRNNLPELQMLNPTTNFTIQELSFGEPYMHVAYSGHDIRIIRLAGATEEEFTDIIQACVTYGNNHSLIDRPRNDDGGDPLLNQVIINFGYTDSFLAKLEKGPLLNLGQGTTFGVDDPGQRARMMPRNLGSKITP